MEEHRLSREMHFSSTSINTHAHVSRIFWRTSSYFGKEIGHWSCPIVKLTYPRNGVTSTRRYPLNTDLFNVEAEIRDITYAYVCIYIYIYLVAGGRIVSPHWMENIPAGLLSSTMSRGGGALRSFNIFRQQTARVHLVIKSVWSANIAASMHAACLHRVAGPATGGGGEKRERGREERQETVSTPL